MGMHIGGLLSVAAAITLPLSPIDRSSILIARMLLDTFAFHGGTCGNRICNYSGCGATGALSEGSASHAHSRVPTGCTLDSCTCIRFQRGQGEGSFDGGICRR